MILGGPKGKNVMEKYKLAKLNDRDSDISKTWYVYFSYRNPESNKFQLFQHYISSKLLTKKARYEKANELIDELNAKLQKGWNPFSNELRTLTTVSEVVQRFYEVKESELRRRTILTYKSMIKLFQDWLIEKSLNRIAIENFTFIHAIEFMDMLKYKKKVSNRTYNNYLITMRTIFNWLQQREYVVFNVFKRINVLQEEEPELIGFDESELRAIRTVLPYRNKRLWMIAQLIFYCFMRPQEIVRLKHKDINIRIGRIIINGNQSKNKKTQVVELPKAFLDQIDPEDWVGKPNDYIFSRKFMPGNKEILPIRIAEAWQKFAREMGIDKPIYGLKHTGVGMAFDSGINPRDLQIHIRHASLDETMKYLNRFRMVTSERLKNEFPSFS